MNNNNLYTTLSTLQYLVINITMDSKIHDVLYGDIILSDIAMDIIDKNKIFGRLQEMYQLGLYRFVNEKATHTRKEHSIGVAYLAGLCCDIMGNIQQEDRTLCEIAGLLHDIGHGPFSHTFCEFLESKNMGDNTHELRSQILAYIICSQHGMHESERQAVMYYVNPKTFDSAVSILGISTNKNRINKKIAGIVCTSGKLDVDRIDHARRDAYYLGIDHKIQLDDVKKLFEGVKCNKKLALTFDSSNFNIRDEINDLRDKLKCMYTNGDTDKYQEIVFECLNSIWDDEIENAINLDTLQHIDAFAKLTDKFILDKLKKKGIVMNDSD